MSYKPKSCEDLCGLAWIEKALVLYSKGASLVLMIKNVAILVIGVFLEF